MGKCVVRGMRRESRARAVGAVGRGRADVDADCGAITRVIAASYVLRVQLRPGRAPRVQPSCERCGGPRASRPPRAARMWRAELGCAAMPMPMPRSRAPACASTSAGMSPSASLRCVRAPTLAVSSRSERSDTRTGARPCNDGSPCWPAVPTARAVPSRHSSAVDTTRSHATTPSTRRQLAREGRRGSSPNGRCDLGSLHPASRSLRFVACRSAPSGRPRRRGGRCARPRRHSRRSASAPSVP